MNINTHAEKAKRAAQYAQTRITPVAYKSKKQFLNLMQKAAVIAKTVTSAQFSINMAAIGWAILNAGYTYITGASAWLIQTIAHGAVDAVSFLATSVTKTVGKVWGWLNKAQKVLTKKDLPGLNVAATATVENAVAKAKADIDWFCESGVRFMMDPITRTTFFVFSTIAIAPIVLNAWTNGALFAWAQQGVLRSVFVSPWFGGLLFVGAMTGCLAGAIEVHSRKKIVAEATGDLAARNELLEAELADALEAVSIYTKITDKQIKRGGSGYMPKQQKAARV